MRIVWDEPKRLTNLQKHRLDFADLTADWFFLAVIGPARGNRLKAVWWWKGEKVTVIHARLGSEAIAVISMRPADEEERNWI